MNLKKKINDDLKNSMKSGDTTTRGVLRLLNSDIKNLEIEKSEEISENEIIEIIKKNIKRRKDSIEQYKNGNREDLADKEKEELTILEKYMPEQMSEEEIRRIVINVIKKSEMSSTPDSQSMSRTNFGKIMGLVMKETKGMADGNTVSEIVKKELK